jgi:hypothetical protein
MTTRFLILQEIHDEAIGRQFYLSFIPAFNPAFNPAFIHAFTTVVSAAVATAAAMPRRSRPLLLAARDPGERPNFKTNQGMPFYGMVYCRNVSAPIMWIELPLCPPT